MNACTRIILAAGVTVLAGAAPKESDHRELQGRWRVVTVRQEAINEAAAVDGFAWIFARDAVTMTRDGKETATGTFRLRPTATPKEIDFRFSSLKGEAGQTKLGIYLLEENRLTICASFKDDQVRPRHFPTAGDFSPDKIVFRRDAGPKPGRQTSKRNSLPILKGRDVRSISMSAARAGPSSPSTPTARSLTAIASRRSKRSRACATSVCRACPSPMPAWSICGLCPSWKTYLWLLPRSLTPGWRISKD